MPVIQINSKAEFDKIIAEDKVVIIDFWATWCAPCRAISPIFEKFSDLAEHTSIGFYKVDCDALSDVAQEAGVRAMPTFLAFKNGNKFGEPVVGARPDQLEALIKKNLS